MLKTRDIRVRVTKQQYEMIHLRKEKEGYLVLSQFIRDLLLKDNLATVNMIKEIHQRIVGGKDESLLSM